MIPPAHTLSPWSGSRPPARRCRGARGFTLVEILTATAIMALIVSLVMTILSQVMSAWNHSTDQLTLSGDARQTLEIISQDLQAAVYRRDGNQWFYLESKDATVGGPVAGINASRLIFYSTSPLHQSRDGLPQGSNSAQAIYGDLCAIEYRLMYADPFGSTTSTDKTYSLHRVVLDPATTFFGFEANKPVMGINPTSTTYNTLAEMWSAYGIDDDPKYKISRPPAGPKGATLTIPIYGAKSPQSTLKDNVAQFSVVLYYYASAATVPPIQVYRQDIPFNAAIYGIGPFHATPTAGFLDSYTAPSFVSLAYADITLTILTDEGVQIMQSFGNALPPNLTWTQFTQQYGMTFTQRVVFQNKPT